jgi:transcriptional regulator with XRE-family HTH domain
MGIGERILKIRKDSGLSQEYFAEKLGAHGRSVQRWEAKDAYPGGEILKEMCFKFHANISWLLTGEGEPYLMKRDSTEPTAYENEEVPEHNHVNAPESEYVNRPRKDARSFKISEALAMAARVLESRTSFAAALYLNIEHFDRAIQAESRITELEESQKKLEEKMAAVESQLTKLTPTNPELKERSGEKVVR